MNTTKHELPNASEVELKDITNSLPEKKLEQLLAQIESSLLSLQKFQKSIQDNMVVMQSKELVIEEMCEAIKAYRHASLKWVLKNFVRPRIGSLYQYPPRPNKLPKRYKKLKSLSSPPKISIVTPSYNQGKFIEKTICSVLDQNYPNLEYIVQDGGSLDETTTILDKYSPQLKHWESKTDQGQSHAINLGFQHATGDIMAYLNSDDILLPGSLNYIAHFFENNPNVDVIYGHRVLVDEYDHEIGRWVLPPHEDKILRWADYVPQETLFWRRSIWEKAGSQINEDYKFAMDWELLIRLLDTGATFRRLPRFLGAFRIHTAQKTSTQISDTGIKEMQKLRLHCHQRAVSDIEISKNIRPYLLKHVILNKLHRIGLLRY